MADGTLYTYPENFRAYKAQIAARYSGAKLTVVSQGPDFKFGETNKTEAFLKKFPLGKVPAFEGKDGFTLFESNAIAQYVANDALRGASVKDAALVQQWVNFADSELLPAACTWVFPCLGVMQYNKQNTERAKEEVKRALGVLNQYLETRTYLVGERISLADISVVCNLLALYTHVLEPEFRAPYVNTNRWFTTLVNQPEVKAVVGDVTLCSKMAQFDAKKFAELQPKGGKEKKAEKQEKKQEKKQPEKKPEKAKEVEAEVEEDEEPREKPSKDPFANVPKSLFVFDDWKKCYSNEDTAKVAIPYFWDKFDKETCSIWYSEYMYPKELAKVYMTCNLVSGMFQRLDRMRKHSFGSVLIFGEDNDNSISGVWVWRGQDLVFDLSPDLQGDHESYSWKKLDPDNAEHKKMINEYLLWEGDFDGKKLNQGKIYK